MPKINKMYTGKRIKVLRTVSRTEQTPEVKQAIRKFRDSDRWIKCQKYTLNKEPICRKCKRNAATTVHHIDTLEEEYPHFKSACLESNLVPLCTKCHGKISHIEKMNPEEAKKIFRKQEE
jgi:hypothetical protein